jgi:hypothetical protein
VQSSPPSLPYNLTTVPTASREDGPRSPSQIPLPLSPLPASPAISRIRSDASLKSTQTHLHLGSPAPIARLPRSVSKQHLNSRPPPPRPPRPQISLPNLRPTVVVSPDLLTALPSVDRPHLFQPLDTTFIERQQAPSPTSIYSQSSHDRFATPLPSPAFFAPRTWHTFQSPSDQIPEEVEPINRKHSKSSKASRSSKSHSPTSRSKASSPSSNRYYNSKWPYENITRDSMSITALPPLLPPPSGPLPDPPPLSPAATAMQSLSADEEKYLRQHFNASRCGEIKKQSEREAKKKKRDKGKSKARSLSSRSKGVKKSNILLIRHPSNAEKIPVQTNPLPHFQPKSNTDRFSWPSPHINTPGPHHDYPPDHHQPLSPSYAPPFTELPGSFPNPITIDLTYPPSPPTFWKRHRRKILAVVMVLFVLSVTAGITTGIIWRLQRIGMVGYGSGGGVEGDV